jgi:glutathione S-transferase
MHGFLRGVAGGQGWWEKVRVNAFGATASSKQRKKSWHWPICAIPMGFYSTHIDSRLDCLVVKFRTSMLTLFHHPLCPHSRYVRLILGEYAIVTRLVEERFWERREEFLLLNPAGELPVLMADSGLPIPGAAIIAEYIEETRPASDGGDRLLPAAAAERVEVRRLANWFNDKFHAETSGPLVTERVFKRHMTAKQGGGPPDAEALRVARHNIRYHMAYIGWLVRTRDWLAGDRMSLADLAAAAHFSAADYLGDVPWNEDEAAKNWYVRVKSRPSFRPLLADTLAGLPPSKTYTDLDF